MKMPTTPACSGQRLLELRVAETRLEALDERRRAAFKWLETLDDPDEFFDQIFSVVKPALLADYRRHLDAAPPYVDEPSVPLSCPDCSRGGGASRVGPRPAGRAPTSSVRTADRAATGTSTQKMAASSPRSGSGASRSSFHSPVWPAVVEKLSSEEPANAPAYPEDFEEAMRRCVHDISSSVRRRQLDLFGRYAYELSDEMPWQFTWSSARIAWTRHATWSCC